MNPIVIIMLLSLIFLAACAREAEPIIETVVVQSTVEVPATVEVTKQFEVTRLVEVTKETIREVEVTREILVEISRIVETIVTATPPPTVEPTLTSTSVPELLSQPIAPSSLIDDILRSSKDLYKINQDIRGEFHWSWPRLRWFSCETVINFFDRVSVAPTYDVSGAGSEIQYAYDQYRLSVEILIDVLDDLVDGCLNDAENPENIEVTEINWGILMDKLNQALNAAGRSIETLEMMAEG